MFHGGKSLVTSPPTFSNDGQKLLVCTGSIVSIFSTSTGMLITELEGHSLLVTSVVVVPNPHSFFCYCWTSSLDGTIRYWDFSAPQLIKKIDIRLPIFSMVIPSFLAKPKESGGKPADVFAYVTVEGASRQENKVELLRGQIRKCNLTESRLVGGLILAETSEPAFLTSCSSGDFFGIQKKRVLYIWKVPAKDYDMAEAKKMRLHHTKNFSTLAFHPFDKIVAAGDVSGRILIWRGVGRRMFSKAEDLSNGRMMRYEDDKPGVRGDDDAESCSTWHWHSSEVNLLLFSSDGSYLYSGGNEGVLVMWQLDTGKKKFLPRIGSPLLYYVASPDSLLSSISCADNKIVMLNMSSWEIMKSIAGIKPPCSHPVATSGLSSGFIFDQAAGLVAVRTENYCIQFYSLVDNREISEVQVIKRNHQPADVTTVGITLMALSPDGSMMSTVETRLPEEGIGGLISLKFWASESQKKDFSLTTIVYEPHEDAAISAVAFHPTRQMLVSSSYGGDFKTWVWSKVVKDTEEALESSGWTCHAVGSYKRKPMTAASFSSDGTVLAVAVETVITLWDPDKNFLVTVIGNTHSPIISLSFVGEYLVSTSHGSMPQLRIWSMGKLSVTWSYKLHAEGFSFSLPKSPDTIESDGTKINSRDGVILIFNVSDPNPVVGWSAKKATGGGLSFLPGNQFSYGYGTAGEQPSELLVFMNGDHEYVVFDPHNKNTKKCSLARSDADVGHEGIGQFGYAALYGALLVFEPKREADDAPPILSSKRLWEAMFSGPTLALPPLTEMCAAFLESFHEKRTTNADWL
ncbi:hypothetical protein Dimus_016056 [Dionaea muscipula]